MSERDDARTQGAVESWATTPRLDFLAHALIVLGAVLCTRRIANDFLWGHDGGNGAPYWSAARTSLEFGLPAQVKAHAGSAPPGPDQYYMHHPLLLHAHLVLARAVLGGAEWVGRAVPYAYSVAGLVAVHRVARALFDARFALAALAIYLLTPLHLVFATMIDHEQGGIFWTLIATFSIVRAIEAGAARHRAAMIVAATLAMQFAWGAYFVLAGAFAVGVAVALGSRAAETRARARWVAVALALTALANLAGFFVAVVLVKGSLADAGEALSLRSASPDDYGAVLRRNLRDLYGAAIVAVAAAGAFALAQRARRGDAQPRDLVAVAFVAGQVGLSLVFANAGRIHSYWTYFGGVGVALLGAEGVVTATRALRARLPAWACAGALAAAFVLQARFALERCAWAASTGLASYATPFDDQWALIQVAKHLRARYGDAVVYALHDSLQARDEVHYYLDAPHMEVTTLVGAEAGSRGARCPASACALLIDLGRVDRKDLGALVAWSASHPTSLFDGRFLAIETSAERRERRAFRLAEGAASWPRRWLVDDRRPAPRLIELPAEPAFAAALTPGASTER